ncbi:MAG: ABC transporter ATP-binding protein [Candidatus Pacebacteria bacterium]|nr:ABC transporter ATP-binding protein [Candidatus Paceibacterota bacterium]
MEETSPSLIALLKPYWGWVLLLTVLTILANGLNLIVPEITAHAIDAFTGGNLVIASVVFEFVLAATGIFIFTFLQTVVQTYASERVARDLRNTLAAKISIQEYATIDSVTPAKLLTNLTSDIDAVKTFVSQAIASIISSVFLIIGACTLLLLIDWRLALAVMVTLPIIAISFYTVLGRVRKLFRRSQEIIDWLNRVISESILGAALIRLVNSRDTEYEKFVKASGASKDIGLRIIGYFSLLIPLITFVSNIATLIILSLGGYFVIHGTLSLGNFTAFNNYLIILIFPILIIGFMSNVIAQASASYARVTEVLNRPDSKDTGTIVSDLTGAIEVKEIFMKYGEHHALRDVSFAIKPHTRNAIIGPTAAGKTQILYLLTGLLKPTAGLVEYDGEPIDAYNKERLHEQVGFVFQDSIMFNLTLRENIAFSNTVKDEDLQKAIDTAALQDFISTLPQGLDTIVSERGTSLSGGQKQRVMLARALALNPKILLLDDFTARVDTNTERTILANVAKNYPEITLISVTQKIAPIESYDQIILLMEGEVLAIGTHQELMRMSPEYVQIYDSQKSTESYE